MKWFGFILAFVLVVIVPVWIIKFGSTSTFQRFLFTIVGGIACYFAVEKGGWKKGLIVRK